MKIQDHDKKFEEFKKTLNERKGTVSMPVSLDLQDSKRGPEDDNIPDANDKPQENQSTDFKALKEASYCNIPVIALCDTHNSLKYVDLAIPCNNNSTESISMVFWMLAREVLTLRGQLDKDEDWEVMVDLFYHKNLNEKTAAKDENDGEEDDEARNEDEDEDEDNENEEEEQ